MKQRFVVSVLMAVLILCGLLAILVYLKLSGEIETHQSRAVKLEDALKKERTANRLLLQQLARARYQSRRYRGRLQGEAGSGEQNSEQSQGERPEASVEEEKSNLLDFDALRERFLAGDFDFMKDLITPESLEATLEKHGRNSDFLVAAAMMSSDQEVKFAYLEEALEKDRETGFRRSTGRSRTTMSGSFGQR